MFESLVAEYLEHDLFDLVEREAGPLELPEPKQHNLIYAITDVRRCGKTFFMFQTMCKLIEAGVPPN